MLIWLLASQLDNKIPNDAKWIASRIGEDKAINLKPLIDSGFLLQEQNASNALAKRSLETEGETEGETETEAHEALAGAVKKDTWDTWVAYRKEIKKALKPSTEQQQIKSLLAWRSEGHDCNEIIVTSIRNGWTGLFSPDGNKKKKPTNGSSVEFVANEELESWARRNGAPLPKQRADYTYDLYRDDLIRWEQAR